MVLLWMILVEGCITHAWGASCCSQHTEVGTAGALHWPLLLRVREQVCETQLLPANVFWYLKALGSY